MRYSVIIPVYNAENTLRRCVDSLLDQNCADTEIILVDDGSEDGSAAICRKYARDYETVRCISKQHAGVSAARNTGLNAARGDYILFVDSDDYVEPNFFSVIDQAVEAGCADWVHFSISVDDGMGKRRFIRKAASVFSREELLPHIIDAICRKTINGPWAKLFRRDVIEKHHIRFLEGASVGEDRAFNIVYSFYIHSCAVSRVTVYVLNTENENSLSRRYHEDLHRQLCAADDYIKCELAAAPIPEQEKERYREALSFCDCIGIYRDAKKLIRDRAGWCARQKLIFQLCNEINRKHLKYPRSGYCALTSLPVRLSMTPVIDAMAWMLANDMTGMHRGRLQ